MAKPFKVHPFTNADKSVLIEGPDYLRLAVDFDDVNHAEVRKQIAKLVVILNEGWEEDERDDD